MTSERNYREPVLATSGDFSHFVGFHDINPWDATERYLVVHRCAQDTVKTRTKNDYVEICVWDTHTNEVQVIDRTNTWNYQQGARLQWIPGTKELLYNSRKGEQLICKIYHADTRQFRELPVPVYGLSKDPALAVTYNFARLGKYWKGYGYADAAAASWSNIEEPFPKDDGLFLVNLQTGDKKLLISIHDVAKHKQDPSTADLPRFFTHAAFSPDGKRICFFERFHSKEGGLYSRFFVINMDGSGLKLLGEGKQSHFDWFDNEHIMIWSRPSGSLVNKFHKNGLFAKPGFKQLIKLVRKLRPGLKSKMTNEYYRLIGTANGVAEQPIAKNLITEDGHPMFSKDKSWFVNDTYPKADGHQTLMLYQLSNNKRIDLAELFVPEVFRDFDLKCDLHPRWNGSNQKICVDSAHSGKRQVYIFDVKDLIQ